MIKERLNALIMEGMKNKDQLQVAAAKAVKQAFMEFETSKERLSDHKVLDEANELAVVRKLVKQRKDAVEEYVKFIDSTSDKDAIARAGKNMDNELAESHELEMLFLPAGPKVEDITAFVSDFVAKNPGANMGMCMKAAKGQFPTADGKTLSEIVKSNLA